MTRDVSGPGSSIHGSGFLPDTPVVLNVTDKSGTVTLDDSQMPALRTDGGGLLTVRLTAEPDDVGIVSFQATAGDCSADASTEVTAAMFGAVCPAAGDAEATASPQAAAYAEAILADRPIGYWRFEETSGSIAAAAAGDAGTYRGGPALSIPGVVDGSRAVSLDGVDDWIELEDLELAKDFTVEAWVFLCGTSIGNADAVVGVAGNGPDINFFEEQLRLYDGDGNDPAIAPSTVEAGRWMHIAASRKGGELTLYVDGLPVAQGQYAEPFPISAIGWGNAGNLEGLIDEVAIYDRTVPADHLAARVEAAGR